MATSAEQGDPETESPFSLLHGTIFPGRVPCPLCGFPFPAAEILPRGLCMSCDAEVSSAKTLAVLLPEPDPSSSNPVKGFRKAIEEVRKHGRPLTVDMASAVMDRYGGPEGLIARIADDLDQIRGTNLPEHLREFHDVDWKVVNSIYSMFLKLATERDALVGEDRDPFEGVSEEDLLAVASQAAFARLPHDPEFRQKLLEEIAEYDPQRVIDAAAVAIDRMDGRVKVEVVGG